MSSPRSADSSPLPSSAAVAGGAGARCAHLTYDAGSCAFFTADRHANARNHEVRVRADGDAAIAVDLETRPGSGPRSTDDTLAVAGQ